MLERMPAMTKTLADARAAVELGDGEVIAWIRPQQAHANNPWRGTDE